MRKTKIICTLGPASDSEEVIEQLILSGMDAARFNFSHGTHETHSALLTRFKRVRDSLGRPVATILDTKGPEIRIRTFGCGRIELNDGDHFTLTTRETEGDTRQVSVTYSNLHQELQSECHILIDDGLVDLEVEEIDGQDIRCRVVTGGPLSNHKSINIPGVSIALPRPHRQGQRRPALRRGERLRLCGRLLCPPRLRRGGDPRRAGQLRRPGRRYHRQD